MKHIFIVLLLVFSSKLVAHDQKTTIVPRSINQSSYLVNHTLSDFLYTKKSSSCNDHTKLDTIKQYYETLRNNDAFIQLENTITHPAVYTKKPFYSKNSIHTYKDKELYYTSLQKRHDTKYKNSGYTQQPQACLDITSFYQESTNKKDLRNLFFGVNHIIISNQDAPIGKESQQISPTWLSIAGKQNVDTSLMESEQLYVNDFSSKITIRPFQKRFGSIISLTQRFEKYPNIWARAQMPIVHIEASEELREYNTVNNFNNHNQLPPFIHWNDNQKATEYLANLGNAIENNDNIGALELPQILIERPSYHNHLSAKDSLADHYNIYGRITNTLQKKAGFSDLLLMVGYSYNENFNPYIKATFPTGGKADRTNLMPLQFGNGGHFCLGIGYFFNKLLYGNFTINHAVDIDYLFKNKQIRSFDIGKRLLSRYGLFVPEYAYTNGLTKRGTEVFSLMSEVKPGISLNISNSCIYKMSSKSNLEFGYNIWAQTKESLKITQSCPNYLATAIHLIIPENKEIENIEHISQPFCIINPNNIPLDQAYDIIECEENVDLRNNFIINKDRLARESAEQKHKLTQTLTLNYHHQYSYKQHRLNTTWGIHYEIANTINALENIGGSVSLNLIF